MKGLLMVMSWKECDGLSIARESDNFYPDSDFGAAKFRLRYNYTEPILIPNVIKCITG